MPTGFTKRLELLNPHRRVVLVRQQSERLAAKPPGPPEPAEELNKAMKRLPSSTPSRKARLLSRPFSSSFLLARWSATCAVHGTVWQYAPDEPP